MKVNAGIFILLSIFIFLLNTHNSFSQTSSPLTLSEIMFSPSETNGEFVEVFNTSLTQSVDLNGYKIKYHTSSNNNIVSVSGGTILGPKKYAVIIQGSYDFNSGIYKTLIPGNTIILKTSGNNFGSSGMANTTSRVVNLINPSGQIADTYTYSANNTAGYSDEKIEMTTDNSSINWNNSIILHGTPGYKNSVSPVNYDLSVGFLSTFPVIPKAEDSVNIKTVVKNTGKKTAQNFRVEIFKDVNFDSIGQIEENIFSELYFNLSTNDSIIIEKKVYIDSPGLYSFIAVVSFAEDENILNNRSFLNFTALEKPAEQFEIVINEIMYSPTDDEPEWIEIYNRSDRSLNLKDYSIGDNSAMVVISYDDFVINPCEFLVISDDVSINNYHQIPSRVVIKSLPSLNNSGDDIILHNNEEETVDSVKYFSAWGGTVGKSLERIAFDSLTVNASNWKTSFSQFKSTPGKINSVSPKDHDISVNGFTTNVNYIEAGRSLDVKAVIKNFGNTAAKDYTIRLFNDRNMNSTGEPAELIEENKQMLLEAADTNEIIFSILGFLAGVNRLIVLVDYEEDQYIDNNSMSMDINAVLINEQRNDIVINEIMYAPNSPECEWIELFNRSSKELELKGYQIADDVNKYEIISETLILKPDEFLIICRDSIISSLYHNISRMVASTFPSLNNSGDRIVLMDSLGRTIDSLEFDLTWGGTGGKSLERISPDIFSIDGTNWKSSASKYNATPGRINSLSGKKYDLSINKFISNPKYVEIGNYIKLEVGIENTGTETANNFSVKLFLDKNLNMKTEENEIIDEFKENVLMPGYSNQVDFSTAQLELGANQIIVYVDFDKDQYYDNNTGVIIINAAVLNEVRGDLVINEIMYEPLSPEPEWVELYNKSSKVINIKGYHLSKTFYEEESVASSYNLKPENFVVIARDSSIYSTYPYLQNVVIANFSQLNNSLGKIVLADSLERVIDSLEYKSSWGGSNGKSLERYEALSSSEDSANWKTSLVEKGGTPGKINTVSKKNFNCSIEKIIFDPLQPQVGDKVKIKTQILNSGKKTISPKLILYSLSTDGKKYKIEESEPVLIDSNSSIILEFNYKINAITKKYSFEAMLELPEDEDTTNNKFVSGIRPAFSRSSIIINEIMFNPINDEPEWIEIYNNTNYDIDAGEITISDLLAKPATTEIKSFNFLKKSFLVISKDSSIVTFHPNINFSVLINGFANLNNDEDGIVLKDRLGTTMDSVRYNKTWGGEYGKSIERISIEKTTADKSNWASSKDIELSTPGRINSVTQKDYDLSVKNFFIEEQYLEIGETGKFKTVIENLGKLTSGDFLVELFRVISIDDTGSIKSEKIGTSRQTGLSAGGTREIEFTTDLFEEGANMFFVSVLFDKDEGKNNDVSAFLKISAIKLNEQRGDLVINEIMYAPHSPEPEWIEIFNKSNKQIDLKNYWVGDGTNKKIITKLTSIINPGEYFVVAGDSAFFSLYETASKIWITDFPSLGNSHDKIVLSDSLGRIIDSLDYKYTWGGGGGKSLERIDVFLSSTDSTNWRTSFVDKGGTPGKNNSIEKIIYDGAVTKIFFIPDKPQIDEEVRIKVEASNAGKNNIPAAFVLYELIPNSSKIIIERSSAIIIPAEKSVTYEFQYKINSINSKHTFEVELELADDNDPANNKLSGYIQPCYKPNFILLNEIMFNPINGEPEWIELYNNSEYNIDIGDWSITDILTKPVKTKIEEEIIPPGSFLIITKDSSVINYHQNILSSLLVNEFANLNNDEDGVILKDTYGVTIDSVRYDKTWGGENGKSLERKSYVLPSTDKSNWASSTDIEQSTPGRVNSSAQKEFDLAVTQINFVPEFPILGNELLCCAKIKNIGIKDAQSFFVNFSFINETDTTLFSSVNIAELKTLDSIIVNTTAQLKLTEPGKILCQIICNSDQDVSNNYLFKTIQPGCKYGSVLISEIMYNPFNGESEWIEIVNNSPESINLKDWSASDIINPTKTCIIRNDCILLPNEFCVLASDTSKYFFFPPPKFFQVKFGSLDNVSDGLIIYDRWNNVIDSVVYNSNWGSLKGFSLERISLSSPGCDSTNWTISLNENGATPGIINSITKKTTCPRNSLIINEIMFDPLPGNSEFIELYNATNDTIQIGGMTLQVGIDKPIIPSHTFNLIPPGSYIVLAKDSLVINNYPPEINYLLVNSSLDLSNEGAQIKLRDMTGSCIDSLIYSPSWHNKNILSIKNRSLERLNPSINSNDVMNWSTSVYPAGATPGKQNSVYVKNISGQAKVTINPNPFSPDNDGFEDFTTINFNLTKHLAQVRIKVFDSIGRHVRTLAHNTPAVSNNTIIFDGLDDNYRALRIGIYILLIEAVADDGSTETIKTPIVVARKL